MKLRRQQISPWTKGWSAFVESHTVRGKTRVHLRQSFVERLRCDPFKSVIGNSRSADAVCGYIDTVILSSFSLRLKDTLWTCICIECNHNTSHIDGRLPERLFSDRKLSVWLRGCGAKIFCLLFDRSRWTSAQLKITSALVVQLKFVSPERVKDTKILEAIQTLTRGFQLLTKPIAAGERSAQEKKYNVTRIWGSLNWTPKKSEA